MKAIQVALLGAACFVFSPAGAHQKIKPTGK
jgi:hypothetical protein